MYDKKIKDKLPNSIHNRILSLTCIKLFLNTFPQELNFLSDDFLFIQFL